MVVYVLGVLHGVYLVVTLGACPAIWVAWVDVVVIRVAVYIVGADVVKALFFEEANRGQILGPHNLRPGDQAGAVLGLGQDGPEAREWRVGGRDAPRQLRDGVAILKGDGYAPLDGPVGRPVDNRRPGWRLD
jgi:hypothetical protein